jgi:hypothetical protein
MRIVLIKMWPFLLDIYLQYQYSKIIEPAQTANSYLLKVIK